MVAPNYAKHRSDLAKKIGLGTRPRRAGVAPAAGMCGAGREIRAGARLSPRRSLYRCNPPEIIG